MNKPITNGRITTWLLLLQEFNIIVIDEPGRENLVADFLSSMNIAKDRALVPILDDFLDEDFFIVSTFIPWFTDMDNYLVTGKLL